MGEGAGEPVLHRAWQGRQLATCCGEQLLPAQPFPKGKVCPVEKRAFPWDKGQPKTAKGSERAGLRGREISSKGHSADVKGAVPITS